MRALFLKFTSKTNEFLLVVKNLLKNTNNYLKVYFIEIKTPLIDINFIFVLNFSQLFYSI